MSNSLYQGSVHSTCSIHYYVPRCHSKLHIMLSALIFITTFSAAAKASPLLSGTNDWESWYSSPQSNAADTQIPSQSDLFSSTNDISYLSDSGSFQFDSSKDLFGSPDESWLSGNSNPEITMAYSGGQESNLEDSMFGSESQATNQFGSDAISSDLTDLPATFNLAGFVPTASDPCPRIETRCCSRYQYVPLLFVEREHCPICTFA